MLNLSLNSSLKPPADSPALAQDGLKPRPLDGDCKLFYSIHVSKTESGNFVVTARGIPECIFSGKTEDAALKNAQDMIPGTLELFYRRKKKPFPIPDGRLAEGEHPVHVPLKVQAKMLLWNFICSKGMSLAEASRQLGIQQSQAQRLVDISKDGAGIDAIEGALERLGGEFSLNASSSSRIAHSSAREQESGV